MTDRIDPPETPDHVVIPYARFVECREKRRRCSAVKPWPPTTDADLPPGPDEPTAKASTGWRNP